MTKAQTQYRIAFIYKQDNSHSATGFTLTGPHRCLRYFSTKEGLRKRFLSLMDDPSVRQIEVTQRRNWSGQGFYCARPVMEIEALKLIGGTNVRQDWRVIGGSWEAMITLFEIHRTDIMDESTAVAPC